MDQGDDNDDKLLTEQELARIFRVHSKFFSKLRVEGGGPIYLKIGTAVRYPWSEVKAWEERQKRSSTSDPGPDDLEPEPAPV
ncbi:helix-turn-helix transcriptional regulator [Leptospira interrogans]